MYREPNHLADGFAKYAFSLDFGIQVFDCCPVEFNPVLLGDINGVSAQRYVLM